MKPADWGTINLHGHLLLGLVREGEGIAAGVLDRSA